MEEKIPVFFSDLLIKQYGKDITEKIIDGYSKKRIVSFRVNNLKSNIKEIEDVLNINNIEYEKVIWYEDAFIIKNVREEKIQELSIYKEGKIYLQSLSSMIPPIILSPKSKENILDMAAAPGGKTTQMASISNDTAMITACEKNKIRAEKLKFNLEKQGTKKVNILVQDSRTLSEFLSFDKILLDAPCSGSGTLTLNENIEKYFSQDLIKRSQKFQEQLIKKALQILKVNGELVYSTCSILYQENEMILNKILKEGYAEIVPITGLIPENIPLLPSTINGTLCVCPTEEYEGFFVAKIIKKKKF